MLWGEKSPSPVSGRRRGTPALSGLVVDPFYTVTRGHGGIIVRRTRRSHTALDEVGPAFQEIYDALRDVYLPDVALLVDLRDVVGRNDPEFEEVIAPHRRRLMQSFGRAAVLVRSSVGAMQIRRLFAADGLSVEVFGDEDEALEWLGG